MLMRHALELSASPMFLHFISARRPIIYIFQRMQSKCRLGSFRAASIISSQEHISKVTSGLRRGYRHGMKRMKCGPSYLPSHADNHLIRKHISSVHGAIEHNGDVRWHRYAIGG